MFCLSFQSKRSTRTELLNSVQVLLISSCSVLEKYRNTPMSEEGISVNIGKNTILTFLVLYFHDYEEHSYLIQALRLNNDHYNCMNIVIKEKEINMILAIFL